MKVNCKSDKALIVYILQLFSAANFTFEENGNFLFCLSISYFNIAVIHKGEQEVWTQGYLNTST
jgi:hypothetical protein